MGPIDFILNVAGILLWLNWRSVAADPFTRGMPATLSGTVRRAQPPRLKRWHYLPVLAVMLFARAVFYQQIGPAVNWTPKLDLYFVVLTFNGALFLAAQLFSLLSFIRAFVIFYFWLVILNVLNRNEINSDPLQKILSLQLGRRARWPTWMQMIVPVLVVATLWMIVHSMIVTAGVTARTHSILSLGAQGLLLGVAIYLTLKFLLSAFLVAHLVTSYVYLGKSAVWDFVSLTARNILAPLNRYSIRSGKVDYTSVMATALVLFLLHISPGFIIFGIGIILFLLYALPNYILIILKILLIILLLQTIPSALLFYLDKYNLTAWPQ